MSNPRSSDQAYYASKTPLVLVQTKEGIRTARKSVSYRQEVADNGTQASSDRYYAELKAEEDVQVLTPVNMDLSQVTSQELLAQVRRIPGLILTGDTEQVRQAQISLDLAVGQGHLTREQLDTVQYREIQTEPVKSDIKEDEARFLQNTEEAAGRGRKRRKKDDE